MISLICEIIQKFGPRLAGSEAEKQSQFFLKNKLEHFADSVTLQTFRAALTSKFRKMKIYAVLYWLSVSLFFLSPFVAFVLAQINAFLTVNDLMRNGTLLDFLFPQKESLNLIATVEPKQKATQTIIFSGHIDSTEECRWWFWLKQWGGYLTFAAGITIVVYAVFCFAEVAARLVFHLSTFDTFNWFFVALAPVQLVYLTFHSKRVVDGASDNLSGIAIAFYLLKHFSENRLQKTRIRFISFGAEEKGLRGSKAYVEQNLEQLKAENCVLVNIDTIRLVHHISIIDKETMIGVRHDSQLAAEIKQSFIRKGFPIRTNPLPMGGTDAVPFSMNNIPAVSVIGLNTKKLDPTYHTRLDVPEMIEEKALENVKEALIDFAISRDNS